jgi:hypothetical protein
MGRFAFIIWRIGFLCFSLMGFNLMDRSISGKYDYLIGPSHHNFLFIIFVMSGPIFTVLFAYLMLGVLDARHRRALLICSALGATFSLLVDSLSRGEWLLSLGLFLVPQLLISFGKNRRSRVGQV